jgi:hypothetical protein
VDLNTDNGYKQQAYQRPDGLPDSVTAGRGTKPRGTTSEATSRLRGAGGRPEPEFTKPRETVRLPLAVTELVRLLKPTDFVP